MHMKQIHFLRYFMQSLVLNMYKYFLIFIQTVTITHYIQY